MHPRATGVTDLRDHAVRIGAEALARGILQNRTDGPSVAVARACHCGLRVQDQHRDAASADGEGQRNEQN